CSSSRSRRGRRAPTKPTSTPCRPAAPAPTSPTTRSTGCHRERAKRTHAGEPHGDGERVRSTCWGRSPPEAMKFLHTADWHVGRQIRGRSRAGEHEAVLTEIVGVAAAHEVDAVLVPGDLFDSAAPTPEAERIVYRA